MSKIYKIIYPDNKVLNHSIKNVCKLLDWNFGDILKVEDGYIEKINPVMKTADFCGCGLTDLITNSDLINSMVGLGTCNSSTINSSKPKSKMQIEVEQIEAKSNKIAKEYIANQDEKAKLLAKDKILEYIKTLKKDDVYIKDITETYQLAKTIKQNIDTRSIENFMISIREFVEDNS